MKKLFLILAAAALLVACDKNKNNEPENPDPKPQPDTTVITQNLIYDQFNEILPLQGMTKSSLESALTSAGWVKYDGTEIYGKSTNNTTSELSYKVNSSDIAYEITLNVRPYKSGDKYESNMTLAYVKDAVKKIGNNCTMGTGKIDCRYLCAYTSIGQRYTANVDEFDATFHDNNLNAVTVYYLDSSIQNWIKATEAGQSQAPFVGVNIGFHTDNTYSTNEFNMSFVFTDETNVE